MIYKFSQKEALARGEIEMWRASHEVNETCAREICKAIDGGYDDLHSSLQLVLNKYGVERVSWVLANMIRRCEPHDPRIYARNRAWAEQVADWETPENYQAMPHPGNINSAVIWLLSRNE